MSASIFVGVDVNSFYEREVFYKEIIKYNVNTGEPYNQKVIDFIKETINGFSLQDLKELGLTVNAEFPQVMFLGLFITDNIDNCDDYVLDVVELTETIKKVESILKEINLDLPVKVIFSTNFD
jgi:phosphoglucomutase